MPETEKRYYCSCGWQGDTPSLSDDSQLRNVGGRLVMDRRHLLVCPVCYSLLNTRNAVGVALEQARRAPRDAT